MYETVSREMMDFVQRSPSCFHAVSELAKMLEQAGFIALQESDAWKLQPGKGYYVTRNGSAVMAFRMPPEKPTGFMIAAAHSDAPTMKLKDIAELSDQNYVRLNVEKYGGAILEPWMDRPLSVAGRVSVQQGSRVFTRLVNIDRDLLLIPHMAIHMDRGMNDGRALNPQIDMLPVYGQASSAGTLKNLIAEAAGVQPEQLLASDLFLYLRQPGSVWGAENEFISSPKLDDLQCAWACTKAICETENKHMIPLCAIFDNEEVGSTTKQGAGVTATVVDLGNRFRLIVNDVDLIKSQPLPKLPVASALWIPQPSFEVGVGCWMNAGGTHHSCFSFGLTDEYWRDYAEIADIECCIINNDTTYEGFRQDLRVNEVYYMLSKALR